MHDIIIKALELAKLIANQTPTKVDDFVIDTILANPNLIDNLLALLTSWLGGNTNLTIPHAASMEFQNHGIDITQVMTLIQLIISIWNQLKK